MCLWLCTQENKVKAINRYGVSIAFVFAENSCLRTIFSDKIDFLKKILAYVKNYKYLRNFGTPLP